VALRDDLRLTSTGGIIMVNPAATALFIARVSSANCSCAPMAVRKKNRAPETLAPRSMSPRRALQQLQVVAHLEVELAWRTHVVEHT